MAASIPATADGHDPARAARWTRALITAVLVVACLRGSHFAPWLLFDTQSLRAARIFLSGFLTPRHDTAFLQLLLSASWLTVAMATAGVAMAWFLAMPLALAIMAPLSISAIGKGVPSAGRRTLRAVLRSGLAAMRSVPELVLALLFVRLLGLGPAAAVLAIAITYSAMLAKVFAEIVEANDRRASSALLQHGASRLGAFFYATLPECAAEFLAYLIYRWECALRASVVMGLVGAGGLGQEIDASIKAMASDEVASMLVVFMLLVSCADGLSKLSRRWLQRASTRV